MELNECTIQLSLTAHLEKTTTYDHISFTHMHVQALWEFTFFIIAYRSEIPLGYSGKVIHMFSIPKETFFNGRQIALQIQVCHYCSKPCIISHISANGVCWIYNPVFSTTMSKEIQDVILLSPWFFVHKTVWDWQVSSVNNIFWKTAWLTLVWINSRVFTLTSTSSNYKISHFSSLSPAIVEAKAHTSEEVGGGGKLLMTLYMCSREDSQTMTSKLSFTLGNWMNSSVCAHRSLWVHFSSNRNTTMDPVPGDDNPSANDGTEQRWTFNNNKKKCPTMIS